jgi:sensor c-di-GMP phosphodiesterase-like protein
MKTRHLVSLVTGILIFSVLVPICLSIWLAHRQAEENLSMRWITMLLAC